MPPRRELTIEQKRQQRIQTQADLAERSAWDKGEYDEVYQKKEAIQKKMIRTTVERNREFFAKVESRMPCTEVVNLKYAQQEDILAKKAEKSENKHWIRNAFKRNAARKQSAAADEFSYDMHEVLTDYEQRKINSIKQIHRDVDEKRRTPGCNKVDWRELMAYSEGYRVNAEGEPATPQDEQAKERDERYINAVLTGKLSDREQYLKKNTEWIMNQDLRLEMLSDYYMRKNAYKVREITDRLLCFDNTLHDPVNKPYFDSLRDDEKAVLQLRMEQADSFVNAVNTKLGLKGIDINTGEYLASVPDSQQVHRNALNESLRRSHTNLTEGREAESDMFKFEADQMANVYIERRRQQQDERWQGFLNRRKAEGKTIDSQTEEELRRRELIFKTPVSSDAGRIMRAARDLFMQNTDSYMSNRELLQKLYQSMYETCELYGNTVVQREAYENAASESNGEEYAKMRLRDAAAFRAKGLGLLENEYKKELDAYQNALSFYLKGDTLTDDGRRVLSEAGVDKGMISTEQKRQKSAAKGK